MLKRIISFSNLTLLVALSLSTVAAYYSIIGLTAIFAGAVIPIIVMGSILEVGKITTTVWLRKYWSRASWVIKCYLVPAVIMLAFLTSMGIFGFLSKAHSDQSLVSGDVLAKLEVYDQKISTAKENIQSLRNELKQMDAAVDQVMARSSDEKGADKSNSIRKSQQRDRARIAKEIETNQKIVASLNDESAPIRAEVRKVEAEVGPIKYIAAMVYGDNPDANLLEAAVRWVIILIVIVFDPLAIALVLAANASKNWDNEQYEEKAHEPVEDASNEEPAYEKDDGPLTDEQIEQIKEIAPKPMYFIDHGEHPKDHDEKVFEEQAVEVSLPEPDPVKKPDPEPSILEKHPYLKEKFTHFEDLKPMVYRAEPEVEETIEKTADSTVNIEDAIHAYDDERLVTNEDKKILAAGIDVIDRPGDYVTNEEVVTEGVTEEAPLQDLNNGYVLFNGRHYNKSALQEIHPELFSAKPDDMQVDTKFGIKFPATANRGDIFVRVDLLPNRVYKFDSKRWIEINKENTDTYLHDQEYIKYLVGKISSGEYDLDLLSENERTQIEEFLREQNK